MQPFARPVVRAVWGHARPTFNRAVQGSNASFGSFKTQSSSICTHSRIRAIAARARSYSTQIPPKDSVKDSSSTISDGKDPPKLDSQPPPSEIKTEATKSTNEPHPSSKQHELPSAADSRRSHMTTRFSNFMDNLQSRVLIASQALNDITGYTGIEAIKKQNAELETALHDAQKRVREARHAYKIANTKRSATQREVNTLLARKDTWTPSDVERFTDSYRTDHELEGSVADSQTALTEAEADEQNLSQRLTAGILKRYHEEQIWSDRIRRASTWGTWGLMGMNFLLFVVLQFVAEPWKRKRLVQGVVEAEKEVLQEVRDELAKFNRALERGYVGIKVPAPVEALVEAVAESRAAASSEAAETVAELPEGAPSATSPSPIQEHATAAATEPAETTPPPPGYSWGQVKGFLLDPAQWKSAMTDLGSERLVELRMKDASLLVLESVAAGAVVTGGVVFLLLRNR